MNDTYSKLLRIFEKVDYFLDDSNENNIDELTHIQCTLPTDLNEIRTELLTLFE